MTKDTSTPQAASCRESLAHVTKEVVDKSGPRHVIPFGSEVRRDDKADSNLDLAMVFDHLANAPCGEPQATTMAANGTTVSQAFVTEVAEFGTTNDVDRNAACRAALRRPTRGRLHQFPGLPQRATAQPGAGS